MMSYVWGGMGREPDPLFNSFYIAIYELYMLYFSAYVQSDRQQCASKVLQIEFFVPIKICNNKATSCLYVLGLCYSIDYLLLLYGTGGLYCKYTYIVLFGIQ